MPLWRSFGSKAWELSSKHHHHGSDARPHHTLDWEEPDTLSFAALKEEVSMIVGPGYNPDGEVTSAPSGLEQLGSHIEGVPTQLDIGLAASVRFPKPDEIRDVLIVGLGGSAIAGDVLLALTESISPIRIGVSRSSTLPLWVSASTAVVCVSYSGATQETISCAQLALDKGSQLVAITSGGLLAELTENAGMPVAAVPGAMPPRAAIGFLFGALAGTLASINVTSTTIVHEAAQGASTGNARRREARQTAEALISTVPVIYGAEHLGPVAYRWKTQLNENAKIHAFTGTFPEVAHNELEAWGRIPSAPFVPVILRDESSTRHTQAQFTRYAEALSHGPQRPIIIRAQGESGAETAFNAIAYGDWMSYHIADHIGIDPIAIPKIQALKSTQLSRNCET